MDKQQLLGYFQDHYLSRQDVLFKLPLNISIDSFWQDLVNQRKARATMLPLYSATGQPYWFVTTDKMVKASERLCEEAMKHDSFFDPYRIPLSQSLTSALSQEAYFTSFVEGADYPIQAAVDFLRRGSEPENAYEQNIMNNYQAGSYLLSALSIPFDEGFVKELAATLTDGQDGYRTTDTPGIPAMEGEPYMVPPAHMLADRMGQFYAFLADVRVHPLIKAAVGQAYILATRPFQEANERLGRLISNAVLLRYGYDFFLDISISAYIARESYRYFKAMREIIRSDNDGDLTYFVEYYLELLVRALDGTRMEEAERLQSQLESERKMALQPLKPTVQYTQPHSYNAEAVARVIDNAESGQDAEDGGDAPQGERGVVNDAIDGTAPDPPELPGGDASYRSSQSQAGSTQGDKQGARSGQAQMNAEMRQTDKAPQEVLTPIPPGEAGPQAVGDGAARLFGITEELRGRIGKMLKVGLSSFSSLQWAEAIGLSHKAACYECRGLYLAGLADRTKISEANFYTLRFSSKEYSNACTRIRKANYAASHSPEDWDTTLSQLEQSGTESIVKAASYIKQCLANGVAGFYASDFGSWGKLQKADCQNAIQILAERGIVQRPTMVNGKHVILSPGSQETPASATKSEGELLQAVVASHDCELSQDVDFQSGSSALCERLKDLRESENVTEQRIGEVLSSFLRENKNHFTFDDWREKTGLCKSVVAHNITSAVDLGLIRKMKRLCNHGPFVYAIIMNPQEGARWDGLSNSTCHVLEGIIRSFGRKRFTSQMAAEATDVLPASISYYLRILKARSIIEMKHTGPSLYDYQLAVPIDEAIQQLQKRGFSPIALVG